MCTMQRLRRGHGSNRSVRGGDPLSEAFKEAAVLHSASVASNTARTVQPWFVNHADQCAWLPSGTTTEKGRVFGGNSKRRWGSCAAGIL